MRSSFLLVFITLFVALGANAAATVQRPNILFILCDDLGWKDLGCYGSSFYETPNLDRLAKEGMRFTQAYAACPVCSPTRASLLSGEYPARVGVTDYIPGGAKGKLLPAEFLHHLPLGSARLPLMLHDAGYTTWHVGKWHLGGKGFYPTDQGFDVNVGGCEWGRPMNGYFSPWNNPTLENGKPGDFLTDKLTDESIKLIKANKDKPFFLQYWSYAPHTPIQAPKELVKKYEEKAKRLGLDPKAGLVEGELFPTINKKEKHVIRRVVQSDPVYAAMIENLDTNIGRLLKAIEETGQADNTLVIFSSDNGGLATAEGSPTSNLPLRDGKGWMYEGGIREPLIVRWPGVVKAGTTTDVPITTPDFYPTLTEAVGGKLDKNATLDGVSFLPVLKGAEHLDREVMYWHYPHYGNQGGTPTGGIRVGDWKLIQFFEDNHVELYNLREDPEEQHNRGSTEIDRVAKMRTLLLDWQQKIGAKTPKPNPDFSKATQ
ncbi:MAG TPA: sulfatase [Tepidisphaeraceae bacterium]|nr:sulfatase [Tepidisphaeraceae bacterium]